MEEERTATDNEDIEIPSLEEPSVDDEEDFDGEGEEGEGDDGDYDEEEKDDEDGDEEDLSIAALEKKVSAVNSLDETFDCQLHKKDAYP